MPACPRRRFALDHPQNVAGLVLERSFVRLGEAAASFAAQLSTLRDPVTRAFAARVWRETFASLVDYDDSADVGALDVTTLIIWGDEDAIIDRSATETLVRSIRHSKLVVCEGIVHSPHWEDPARFARDVAEVFDATRGGPR